MPRRAHWQHDTPMTVQQSEACIYNIPTKDIHVALFLTEINFPTISNRQNQSVVNAFIYVLSHCPPTPVKGAIGMRR